MSGMPNVVDALKRGCTKIPSEQRGDSAWNVEAKALVGLQEVLDVKREIGFGK
jgi:hypothetical protein